MEHMCHSSTFLLPISPDGPLPSVTYALIVLNQHLPKFAPLLWKHEQHNYVYVLMEEQIGYMMNSRCFSQMKMPLTFETGGEIIPFSFPSRFKPDVIKGDMDSIRTEVMEFYASMGTKIIDESHDQDTTDLHKCVSYIRDFAPNINKSNLCILATGALGGRFDHEMGNMNVLCRFSNMQIILLSDDCLIYLLPKTHHHEIHIQSSVEGPHCGLIPIGMPSGSTTTSGLQWDLAETEMRFGGLVSTSNIVKGEKITVRSDSDLLWTISIKKL